jgi:hypothetical protein
MAFGISASAAVVGGAILGSAYLGSKAAKSAASTQAGAAAAATDAQRDMFERQVELQEPFREAGLAGQNRLLELLGIGGEKGAQGYGRYATADFTPANFLANQDPGYAFRMSEGLKGLERSAAARGGLLSGSALKGIQRYSQGLASDEYQNAFNRYQTQRANTLNPYASLAGVGQTSANAIGNAAGQFGQQMGANIIGAGNAAAAGQIGQANAFSSGVGQGINFYQGQQYLNSLPNYSSSNYLGTGTSTSGFGIQP